MCEIFDFAAEVTRRKPAPLSSAGSLDFFDLGGGGGLVGIDACLSPVATGALKMWRRLASIVEVTQVKEGGMFFFDGTVMARDVRAMTKAAKLCGVRVHAA